LLRKQELKRGVDSSAQKNNRPPAISKAKSGSDCNRCIRVE
jgi:hypothetical protein